VVPKAHRSDFVVSALCQKLESERTNEEREAEMIAACDALNACGDLNDFVEEWDKPDPASKAQDKKEDSSGSE